MDRYYVRKPRNKEYRPSKEELLKMYERGLTQKEIAEQIGWTQSGISMLTKRYDINIRETLPWTEKEEELLSKFYLKRSKKQLIVLLPDRTWNAIKLKALKLNLARPKEEYQNSEEVKKKLRKLSQQSTISVKFNKKKDISYVLGVLDGDGYTNKRSTVGLETKNKKFAKKFASKLKDIGLNSNMKLREEKNHWMVWGCSTQFVDWYDSLTDNKKIRLLLKSNIAWQYITGMYDSDGALHPCGCPQICGYNLRKNKFISKILDSLNIQNTIHKDKVWIKANSRKEFFDNVHSVIDYRNPKKKR